RAAGANTVDCGSARLAASGAAPAGAAVAVALRPERVRLDPAGAVDTVLAMTVAHVVYQGGTVRYLLKSDAGLELQALGLGGGRCPDHPERSRPRGDRMTKIGMITVGQAPRSDVVPDMAAILGGDVEIIEAGALDGLTREQIAPLAPEGDDEILVTRLADGSTVFVGKTKMIARIEARIAALEDRGVP